MTRLRLAIGAATDAGRVRAVNEDESLAAGVLLAVADGMGGHAGGEVAARTAVEALRASFEQNATTSGLVDAVEAANSAVHDKAISERSLRGMGTTLTAAALVHDGDRDKVALVNVGDSRAYLLDSVGFARLTEDHSLVEEMVRRGELTPEEAAVHPHRHIVTRALGIDSTIEVDAWELEPEPGARLLLCSDGLTNECGDAEIAAVLAVRRPPAETARELVARALAHGGSDNITVVVADVAEVGDADDDLVGLAGGDAASSADGAGEGTAAASGWLSDEGSAAGRSGPDGAGQGGPLAAPIAAAAAAAAAAAEPLTAAIAAATAAAEPLTAAVARSRPAAPPGGRDGGRTSGRQAVTKVVVPATAPLPGRSGRPAPALAPRPTGRRRSEHIMTFRVALFVLVLIAVVGGAAGFVGWFVKASYFVGVDGGKVVVWQGRPGGFLGFQPVVTERTSVSLSSVFPSMRPQLQAGMEEPSLAAAVAVVARLTDPQSFFALPTGSSAGARGLAPGTTLVPISVPGATVQGAPAGTSAPAPTTTRPTTIKSPAAKPPAAKPITTKPITTKPTPVQPTRAKP